jgi:hypothetical protein
MGLSGFSGLTGSAGDFRRCLRVDESSERRMASPWQFSPYLPSLENVKGRPFTQTPGGFLPCESARYRISAAKSPACLPSTVYMASSTT